MLCHPWRIGTSPSLVPASPLAGIRAYPLNSNAQNNDLRPGGKKILTNEKAEDIL
jgi:hypothetical protein